ncbi:TPA: MFS transporter [Salmonella enterica subsp. enterica serovar Infantis]|nr:MFS transporter [Salmonella enterica subsp. enterica serovar Infantis]
MQSNNSEHGSTFKLMLALLAACVAFQLNASMLSPVLVTIAVELKSNDVAVGFSQTAFFTSAALFSLFLPRLSDIVGRKKITNWMLIIMAIGTIISALSTNIEMLYVGRIIQGVCGPIVAICLMMLRSEIKDVKKYGMLMGVITAVNGGIAGIDAILGGVLAQHLGFRSVFWFIGIVSIISVLLVSRFAQETKPSSGTKMDWLGTSLLVTSVGAVLLALTEASKLDLLSWGVIGFFVAVSALSFFLFWIVEKKSEQPLVSIEYLKRRGTWSLLLTTTLTMTGVFAVVNGLVMSYVQNTQVGFSLTADWAGLALLTPYALAGWLVGPFSGRLAPVIGYSNVLKIGLIGSAICIAVIANIGINSLPVLIVAVIITGITYAGMANIMLNGLGIVLSPSDNLGFLPGLNAGAFNLGAGLSFAILPAIQMMAEQKFQSGIMGYKMGIYAGLGFTLLALLSSFLIPRAISAEISTEEKATAN